MALKSSGIILTRKEFSKNLGRSNPGLNTIWKQQNTDCISSVLFKKSWVPGPGRHGDSLLTTTIHFYGSCFRNSSLLPSHYFRMKYKYESIKAIQLENSIFFCLLLSFSFSLFMYHIIFCLGLRSVAAFNFLFSLILLARSFIFLSCIFSFHTIILPQMPRENLFPRMPSRLL